VPRPIVAIVGRPNVRQVTLFNRILGWRKAIVDPQSGLTRDRPVRSCRLARPRVQPSSTPPAWTWTTAKDESQAAIEAQTKVAIDQAQVIVFLLDVGGLTPVDREIAQLLRRSRNASSWPPTRPTRTRIATSPTRMLELGFRRAVAGIGPARHRSGDFLDRVLEALPPPDLESPAEEKADRLAIMGGPTSASRPSSMALLGDERALVSPVPGTTPRPDRHRAGLRRNPGGPHRHRGNPPQVVNATRSSATA